MNKPTANSGSRSLADSMAETQAEEDRWTKEQQAKFGDYENGEAGCPNCGRHRVMRGDDGKHRCEKCSWCIEDASYDADLSRFLHR